MDHFETRCILLYTTAGERDDFSSCDWFFFLNNRVQSIFIVRGWADEWCLFAYSFKTDEYKLMEWKHERSTLNYLYLHIIIICPHHSLISHFCQLFVLSSKPLSSTSALIFSSESNFVPLRCNSSLENAKKDNMVLNSDCMVNAEWLDIPAIRLLALRFGLARSCWSRTWLIFGRTRFIIFRSLPGVSVQRTELIVVSFFQIICMNHTFWIPKKKNSWHDF